MVLEAARQGRDLAAELGLFVKDRAEDVELNIKPALAAGRTVIVDRYILSNMAYQGGLPGGLPGRVLAANAAFPWPDLTFLLEIGVEAGLRRVAGRGAAEPTFENAPYLARVKAVYDSLRLPGVLRLDASLSKEAVFGRVVEAVEALMSRTAD
jgi:dTMP kinase